MYDVTWEELARWVSKELHVTNTRCDVEDNVYESRYIEVDLPEKEISYVFTENGKIILIKDWDEETELADNREYSQMKQFLTALLVD